MIVFYKESAVSDETREKLFISQPKSLSEAVRLVRQIERARKASQSCKVPQTPPKTKGQCHAVSGPNEDKVSKELREMKELVVQMNERIQQLESQPRTHRGRQRKQVCYSCNEEGHFARNCPSRNNSGNEYRGLLGSNQSSNQK